MQPRPAPSGLSGSRNLLVSILFGTGGGVMANELVRLSGAALGGAVAAGAVITFLLPRPLDVRAIVYAFFVPVAMTYGAVAGRLGVLVIGAVAGAFFLFEKTVCGPRQC